jgi:CubicO group peptidase (beta-lactamase class C family)
MRKSNCLLTAALFGLANLSHARASEATITASLKAWLGDQPGGVAAAYIDASGVTLANAGKFSPSDPRPITADTWFEIGSVTKVFTATLLADALQRGTVTLDTTVGAPFAPRQVTLRQLATHTSGLPRMPRDFASSDALNPYADEDLAVLVKSFDAVSGGLKPAPSSYSNFGFAVLGQAVARAGGKPYAELLRERVLGPLGLRDTLLSWRDAKPDRLAPPYTATGPGSNWDLNAFSPAGALVSTTRDLARFVQANLGLVQTPLLATLVATRQAQAPGDAPGRKIGLAWQLERRGAAEIVWHNGATGGYHSFVAFDPVAKIGVVVLTNHAAAVEPLGYAILAGKPLPERAVSAKPAEALAPYLGNYPLTPAFVMAVTAEGDQLFVQATNQPRLKLKPVSTDRYATEGVEAEVSFERNAAGKVTALVLHQNGLDQRAPHLAPDEKPVAPKEIALTAEDLDAYLGRYQLGPVVFTVTRDGTRLFAQLTGQGKAPVFASAKDEFFYKIVNAQLSFVREGGKVVALILHQNGRDQRAERVP